MRAISMRCWGLIQNDLFDLGADLAVPQREGKAERLEDAVEPGRRLGTISTTLNARLAPLTSFVLPGGTPAAAHLHLAVDMRRRNGMMVELAAKPNEPVSSRDSVYESLVDFCLSPAVP